jgi:putative phosphoserine phosphatase/1-acylglycerol-3-phosphate O-acyltransferase
MVAAAIFDLDRTLIPGSSGPVYQRHLADAGLAKVDALPGSGLLYTAYELFGENPAAMQLARLAARTARGWPVYDVAIAADLAADELEGKVLPYAKVLIDEHHQAGRKVMLATTTPECLVEPLANRLGLDGVLATRWACEGGAYTGQLDGPFVWGRKKMAAVSGWAKATGVDLRASYAYSDSVYDVPLLRGVGHPVAVNPDLQLMVVATLNRWPVRHLDVPEGVAKVAGLELQDWFRPFNRPRLAANARFDIEGVDNIPATGPAIVAFNHRSYFDSTAINFTFARSGRSARFLGKKEVFDVPLVGRLGRMVGGIRVDRGSGSDQPLEHAIKALEAGEVITLAPQGTIPRGPSFFDPELKARWGAARLAQATRAPVIPVGLWGTEKVWPRNQRLPNLVVADPPTVTVRVGQPVELHHRSLDADTKRIMSAIVDLLPPEARIPHTPTPEELALTYPPGYSGDPAREADRRPGTNT